MIARNDCHLGGVPSSCSQARAWRNSSGRPTWVRSPVTSSWSSSNRSRSRRSAAQYFRSVLEATPAAP